ncbi:DUF6468 domain-containing protein [Labrenzia sp. CE80]|uniref:DUF6468 domain-containing protein n=1 Tax=Labrenzia sp. CE80 TaxID=1788986 RepID=UPI00129B789A|nr:DUF6468 domain-containing protein [Labrenzia sp. CE80]
MSPLPVGMIIEGLVAVLLLVTIGYCFTLNRRLQRLRADEETLRATISELMTATEIAERAILGLKATASEADKTLGNRLVAAEQMSAALVGQVAEGEKIFTRISQIAEAARAATAERDAYQTPHAGYGHPDPAPYPQGTYVPQHHPQAYAPAPPQYGSHPPAAPAEQSGVGSSQRRSGRTDDIRSAAAEATARLEQFRKRSGGAAA